MERWADNLAETMGFTEVEHTIEPTGVCDRCHVGPTAQNPAGQDA
ncbi:hypothetical protein ACFY3N_18610 [Streptomyces sp. NPDC000348]